MVAKPKVFLSKLADGYAGPIATGLSSVGFFEAVRPGATVFLKPNFTFPTYRPGVMTSFECIKATTECLIQRGYKVIIGEAQSGGYNPFSMDAVFEEMGMNELARQTGARLVNISFTDSEIIKIRVGMRKLSIPMPKLLLHEIDAFITMPVPKIHMNTRVSMSIKNQWGCIQDPAERLKLHPFFAEVIFEVNRRLPKAHSIIDGRFGLNGTGPMRGDVVDLNWLLVSNDLTAADRVCTRMMQIDERSVSYLQHFRRQGWWTAFSDISINEDWENYKSVQFYLERKWTDLPGLYCFNSSFLAWLGYRSPLAGLAHWMLYLFREPFYDYDKARSDTAELHKASKSQQ
ncbi:MAG TPA: DUF362 domain-containing protein [Verrucomicrobiae bacterium]|jgi:uncharacterized protein (DUF362 family)